VVLNPSFPEKDFERLKKNQLVAIQREKVTPVQMGLRVFPELLYGKNHAYGNPLTGSGTESSVKSIAREDLTKFRTDWFKPNNATLVIVGDIAMAEIKPKLEKLFNDWKSGEVPVKTINDVEPNEKPVVYIMDRPGSEQSLIFAGYVVPKRNSEDEIAIRTFNDILGGVFTSRINMNLREDKHWSYGSFSILWDTKAQRPFFIYAPIQSDKTKESMVEIKDELEGIITTKPITKEEFEKDNENQSLSLPGSWETINAVSGSITDIVTYNLPDDYYSKYASLVESQTLNEVEKAAQKLVKPNQLVWVVVGDRAKIEDGIKSLGYDEVKYIDGDGNVIQ
jgi:zinc protease